MSLPARDHRISLADAAAMTRRYRAEMPDSIKAGAFHADQVLALLTQKGCVGLRIYYGKDKDGGDALILVGVDANDKDMTDGIMDEFIFPCPPFCDDGSGLNL